MCVVGGGGGGWRVGRWGGGGSGSIEELWVNKARGGEEERDS